MNKTKFFLITSFALTLFSCSNDTNVPAKDEKLAGELTAIATRAGSSDSVIDSSVPEHPNYPQDKEPVPEGGGELPLYEGPFEDEILAFTGNDIKSFNVVTREIVFNDPSTADYLNTRIFGLFVYLAFYLDENLLGVINVYSPISSYRYNDLVFVRQGSKFYLLDGYPLDENLGPNERNALQLRKENAQKRKAEWDIFIKYLSDAGKIVR
ncbi:MAG: hypothetical protein LBH58_06495 [Tannerellaceae bacterium]|jgi:hypothetical protein|nr:hypothetical protein [Tannerellaceae bacterium]